MLVTLMLRKNKLECLSLAIFFLLTYPILAGWPQGWFQPCPQKAERKLGEISTNKRSILLHFQQGK